jgi:hypothetical protein
MTTSTYEHQRRLLQVTAAERITAPKMPPTAVARGGAQADRLDGCTARIADRYQDCRRVAFPGRARLEAIALAVLIDRPAGNQ